MYWFFYLGNQKPQWADRFKAVVLSEEQNIQDTKPGWPLPAGVSQSSKQSPDKDWKLGETHRAGPAVLVREPNYHHWKSGQ